MAHNVALKASGSFIKNDVFPQPSGNNPRQHRHYLNKDEVEGISINITVR